MELIGALDQRRFRRELRRREEALLAAARASEVSRAPEAAEPNLEVAMADQAAPEWLATPPASSQATRCECDFCGRAFYGYGQFLNHNCHERD